MVESGFEIVCDRREIQKLVDRNRELEKQVYDKSREIEELTIQRSNKPVQVKENKMDNAFEEIRKLAEQESSFDDFGVAVIELKVLYKILDCLE